MGRDSNESRANLKRTLDEAELNRREFEKQKRYKENLEAQRESLQKKDDNYFARRERKAQEYYARIEEHHKNPRSNQQYHVGSVASWIMEGAERFENIVRFLVMKHVDLRQKYLSKKLIRGGKMLFTNASKCLYDYAFGENDIENLNLEFEAKLNSNGQLNCNWIEDSFGDLFKDANGKVDKDKHQLMQALLEDNLFDWVDCLDGYDPDEPGGYFMYKDANGKYNIYPKSLGERDIDDNWIVKSGEEANYIKDDKFQEMMSGFGDDTLSAENYLRYTCPVNCTLQQANTYSPGIGR